MLVSSMTSCRFICGLRPWHRPPAILLKRSKLAGAAMNAKASASPPPKNAFIRIDECQRYKDWPTVSPEARHLVLTAMRAVLPSADIFRQSYHWSMM